MYVRGGSRSGMSCGMSLHTMGIDHRSHIQKCSTEIDVLMTAIEMKVGDDNTAGPSRLEYYQHQTALQQT